MLLVLTAFHTLVSLIGIVAGLVAVLVLARGAYAERWNLIFLVTTILTSATGFLFPIVKLLPSHIVGIASLVVLLIAVLARYAFKLAGGWRGTYAVTATIALWFNVFVLVAQAFAKIPFLKDLAPTQTEPPFAIAQAVMLIVCVVLGVRAVRGKKRAA
jgi:hypothetical protein